MISLGKKLTKIPSIQGGPFLTGANTSIGVQRNIDIDIPAGMNINPSESFIQMRVNVQMTDDRLINLNIVPASNPDLPLMNTDLIRNCWLDMEKAGRVEDIKRVNRLRRNLSHVLSTVDQKQNKPDALNSGLQDFQTNLGYSPFLEVHKGDGFQSTYKDVFLRIKLSDLYEMCGVQYLNTDKTGKVRFHLELEKKNYFQLTERTRLFVENEGFMEDEIPLTADPATTDTFFTQVTYTDINAVPWYNGQPVLVSYVYYDASANPLGVVQEPHTILTVSDPTDDIVGYDSGTVQIVLDEPLSNESQNGQYTDIIFEVNPLDPQESSSWSILTCELVLCEYAQPQPTMDYDDLSYMTFTTEEFNNNYFNLSHIFEIEPNAVNVLLLFDNSTQPISHYNDRFRYRLRTNDQDLVDYDTLVNIKQLSQVSHHALHYDMLSKTLLNMEKQLVSTVPPLNMDNQGAFSLAFTNVLENKVLFLGSPLPLTATIKRFQVIIENEEEIPTNIENIILFKHCMRSIKL